jgi:hypothetical protein
MRESNGVFLPSSGQISVLSPDADDPDGITFRFTPLIYRIINDVKLTYLLILSAGKLYVQITKKMRRVTERGPRPTPQR